MSRTCVLMLSLQSAVSSCTWRYTSAICVHLGCQKPLWVAVCSSERCNRPDRLTAGSPRCGKGPKWPVTHDPALTYNTNQRVMGGEILSAPMELLFLPLTDVCVRELMVERINGALNRGSVALLITWIDAVLC
jgi:hypothetical protein